jgi:hypothetical protein
VADGEITILDIDFILRSAFASSFANAMEDRQATADK